MLWNRKREAQSDKSETPKRHIPTAVRMVLDEFLGRIDDIDIAITHHSEGLGGTTEIYSIPRYAGKLRRNFWYTYTGYGIDWLCIVGEHEFPISNKIPCLNLIKDGVERCATERKERAAVAILSSPSA